MANSQGEENQDLAALYESLNPTKKSLNPLDKQGVIREKSMGGEKY